MVDIEVVEAIAREQAKSQTGQPALWSLYVANITNHLRWIEAAGYEVVARPDLPLVNATKVPS